MKVTILRGVPGSGKSTLAKGIDAAVVSADDYMVNDKGEYAYDVRKLDGAHRRCKRKFMDLVTNGAPVVVDNTNIKIADFAFYAEFALTFEVDVRVITLVCPPAVAFHRGTHNVDAAKVYQMHLDLESETPRIPWRWRPSVRFLE